MYVPDEKMKVNKFRLVAIPRPVEFMRRFGAVNAPTSAYTGDQLAPVNKNKVEMFADAERLNELQIRDDERQSE